MRPFLTWIWSALVWLFQFFQKNKDLAGKIEDLTEIMGASGRNITVYFSPRGGCTEAIIAAIKLAKEKVRVQAYAFTSEPIAKALVEAKQAGRDVAVLIDSDQRNARSNQADRCRKAGITILYDGSHLIAHNKVVIIDDDVVVTGSFNFSAAAESNAENLLVIKNASIAKQYAAQWEDHKAHSIS